MATRFVLPFADVGSGIKPSDGAQLFFSDTGLPFSSDPRPTYTDSGAGTPNANPVIADSKGVFPDIYLSGAYRAVLKDKDGVQIWSADNVEGVVSQSDTAFPKNFATLAAAVADTGLVDGDALNIAERTAGNGGGAMWDVVLSSTVTENTYNIVQCTGVVTLSLELRVENNEYNAIAFGLAGTDTDDNTAIAAFKDVLLAGGHDSYWPPGTYSTGAANWPFRNPVTTSPSLVDYKGMTLRGNRETTIFKTASVAGADVLQLNAIKNITIKDVKLTATISGSTAGSNGVSITNGGENIHVDVDCDTLPGLDLTSYLDGGKAFTIQNGATGTNDFINITLKGKANNCGYGFEKSTPYNEFDIGASPVYSDIVVDIEARDCWRGIAMGAPAATATIQDDEKDCDIKVTGTMINCAQPLGLDRWVRGNVDIHIVNTKPKASLFRPLAADQTVYGTSIKGDYYSNVKVTGTMLEVDNKLIIGGTTQAFSVFGGSDGTTLDFDLDAATVLSTTVDVIDSGGNTIKNSTLRFAKNVVASLPASTALLVAANNNDVTLGPNLTGSLTGTMTGLTTSPTGTIEYSIKGDMVVMEIPVITGTSNSTFTTITGILTDIRPTAAQSCVCIAEDNGTKQLSQITVETDGTMTIYKTPGTAGSWTNSGTKSIQASTITYRKT